MLGAMVVEAVLAYAPVLPVVPVTAARRNTSQRARITERHTKTETDRQRDKPLVDAVLAWTAVALVAAVLAYAPVDVAVPVLPVPVVPVETAVHQSQIEHAPRAKKDRD